MKTKQLLLCAALVCAFSNAALALTKIEYKSQKDNISESYNVSHDQCNSLKANAKDICVSEAKGARKIAKAELEAIYEPSARHTEQVSMAKADAMYDTAKEKCDDLAGNTKAVCRKDAKAIHVTAKGEARVNRVNAEAGRVKSSVRSMANQNENEANYKAAAAHCDSMAGLSKDACVADAKTKFGIK